MVARWRYVPPSAFTCVSIAVGLISIAETLAGRFESAAWLVILAALMDKLDGTTARLLKSASKFGVELDSLADFLSFCVAPAVLMLAALTGEKRVVEPVVWAPIYRYVVYSACALFCVSGALRLAKFNVKTDDYGKTHFFGTPTTICGALLAVYFLTAAKYELPALTYQALPVMALIFSVSMVSRLPLRKVGKLRSLAGNILLTVSVLVVYICGLARVLPELLLAIGSGYVVIGHLAATIGGVRPPRPGEPPGEPEPDEELDDEQADTVEKTA